MCAFRDLPSRSVAVLLFIVGAGAFVALAASASLLAQSTSVAAPPVIATTPVTGKPYQAELTLHTKRSLADGTIAAQDFSIRQARDSSGRAFNEIQSEIPATSSHPAHQFTVDSVFDPSTRTLLHWTSLSKTGTLTHLPPAPPLNGHPLPEPNEGAEFLGHRMILGLLCKGYALQKTIPAGAMGNDAPITTRHEWWIDDDLHLRALEIYNDPQHGQRTFELVSLKRVEPDPAIFHLPSGYTVREVGARDSASVSAADQPLDIAHAPAVTRDEAIAMLASQDRQRQREGAAALVKEAQADTDPAAKDDVAYRLSRANVGIDEAESLAAFAVGRAERDCAGQAAPITDRAAFTREILLARYWDTLGSIYNRQGDTEQAKSYFESAWKLDPLVYYGFHLGRLDEQAGDTQQAVEIYRAALDAPGGDDLKQTIRERVNSLAHDSGTQPVAAGETLVGVPAGLTGSARFDITYFSSADSPAVVFVSGADALRALTPSINWQEQNSFTLPDNGPERVVRRVEVTCGGQPQLAPCQIRTLGAHEARELVRQQ